MWFINRVGVSTVSLASISNLIDVLIERNLYFLRKNSTKIDSVQCALEEADALALPQIIVGGSATITGSAKSLSTALRNVKEESAIVCIQEDEEGHLDAVVLVVSKKKKKDSMAVIVNSYKKETRGQNARITELYKQSGPVSDALSVVEGCLAKSYGFDFTMDWSKDLFFDKQYHEKKSIYCKIEDCVLEITQTEEESIIKVRRETFLIPVSFDTEQELLKEFAAINKNKEDIKEISIHYIIKLYQLKKRTYTVVFRAFNKAELAEEIKEFTGEKSRWFIKTFKWESKRKSVYTANPLGEDAKICFMSPPGGMLAKVPFYSLYRAFPVLKKMVMDNWVVGESKLDIINRYCFEIIAVKMTVKALDEIGVQRDAVLGGSLGELSIPFIMDGICVQDGNKDADILKLMLCEVVKIMEEVFSSQLELSKQYFGQEIGEMEKWYLVCDYKTVQEKMKQYDEKDPIFCIIVGSPNDVIICGSHELCRDLINQLKCNNLLLTDPIYAHTPVLEPYYQTIVDTMKRLKVHLITDLTFDVYGTYRKEKVDASIKQFSENCANCIIKQVDMPGIFNQAYQDGNRIFIDLGSGRFCTRWAEHTFSKKDAIVLSLYDENNAVNSVLNLISIFMENGIKLDYAKFIKWYYALEIPKLPEYSQSTDMKVSSEIKENKQNHDKMVEKKYSSEDDELLQNLRENQLKRNEILFADYVKYQKSLLEKIIGYQSNVKNVQEKPKRGCLYNFSQIMEMTNGKMSSVLGSQYKDIDELKVRARMPLPPYLFVTRITKIDAQYGEIKAGSSIEAEYDIPDECILKTGNDSVSTVVYNEAAHIGIFLTAYMGIDTYSSGKVKFRITDATTRYISDNWPVIGETIKMRFSIDKLLKSGSITIIKCSYKVYAKNELIIDIKESGGFFTQETLNNGGGIKKVMYQSTNQTTLSSTKSSCNVYRPVTKERTFSKDAIHMLLSGRTEEYFGKRVVNSKIVYEVCEEAMFVDEILEMNEYGGKYGYGYVIARKKIESSFWPFKCHFKNDPVLPGTIMIEGLSQTFTIFQTIMGAFQTKHPFNVKLCTGYIMQSRFRGEVKTTNKELLYRLDIKTIKQTGTDTLYVADGEVYCDKVQIIEHKNASVIVSEEKN
ncbi:MAG: hypothetical protein HFG37_06135 [Eubacterium sp.]|nr:hypothetical protein [Eubacterium sp.]